jgi:hypothetical protein
MIREGNDVNENDVNGDDAEGNDTEELSDRYHEVKKKHLDFYQKNFSKDVNRVAEGVG